MSVRYFETLEGQDDVKSLQYRFPIELRRWLFKTYGSSKECTFVYIVEQSYEI